MRDLNQLREHFRKRFEELERERATMPQPVEFGLSYFDCENDVNPLRREFGLAYRPVGWFTQLRIARWMGFLLIWLVLYVLFVWKEDHWKFPFGPPIILSAAGLFLTLLLSCVIFCFLNVYAWERRRKHPSPKLIAYLEAVKLHQQHNDSVREAEEALLRRKRTYWEGLNGYQFESATATVLKLHRFNPKVTKGSGDGGVDIEVSRDGQKGVVQCKAHVSCVGPHTVRDLFGVIHHSEADFGIIVSRGGFTKGAIEFARNKPILLVDTADLIAMQEGRDVLSGGFTRPDI